METTDFSLISKYIVILLPLLIIQFGLMIFAIIDLVRRERVKGKKWVWALVILFVNMIGPIVYFLAGREDE